MTRSIGRCAAVMAGVGALAAAASGVLGPLAAPAGAATKDPCKVVKVAEIQRAFGGTVGSGKKGISTPVSAQCEFTVSADADRPAGKVIVHVQSPNGKVSFTGLKKLRDYAPNDGVASSLYNSKLDVVELLKGDVLVGVQGGFTITDPLPIHFYDDQAQLTQLAQLASKRV